MPRSNETIYKAMKDNTWECFAGFGSHLISDLLATIPLHPATPAYDVCANSQTFIRFKETMCTYMDQWMSTNFLNRICTRSNDSNPFAFADTTDTLYTSSFIFVFRKAVAKVPTALYNEMTAQGLLDPRHTIGVFHRFSHLIRLKVLMSVMPTGEPYTVPHDDFLRGPESSSARVPVWNVTHGSVSMYTLIRAKPSPSAGWVDFDEVSFFLLYCKL